MKSINPTTGQCIKHYNPISDTEASAIINTAYEAYKHWRTTSFAERAQYMRSAAEVLRNNKEHYAAGITEEMGKCYKESLAEIEKCAWVCEHYAEQTATYLADDIIATNASSSFVTYQPLGPILAVMPWNFPFWQVFRFAAPALMAGNVGILKHASNVCGSALAIESVFQKSGFPDNVFRTVLVTSDQVANLIEHPHIYAVTLTGSTQAGKAVAAKAGESLKKTVLELGGSDPYIILNDADLPTAIEACVTSRLINAGQSCIAAKRFIVVESIYDDFLEAFILAMQNITMGDPMDPNTDIGPQANEALRDELHQQVQISIQQGANCVLGGMLPEGQGVFYPPTILTNVKPSMPAYSEELFGPVASVIKAVDEAEAIHIANDTNFGLGAAIFTANTNHGTTIARTQLDAGTCYINDHVKSDPRLPFGGIKQSGYGRELAQFGIKEFVNIKTVWVR